MIAKSEILLGQIRDKFPTIDKVDRSKILKGHSVEQFTFKCRISFYIFALQVSILLYNIQLYMIVCTALGKSLDTFI